MTGASLWLGPGNNSSSHVQSLTAYFSCGVETQSNWLRPLGAEELYSNAEYYATHDIFKKTAKFREVLESVLFTVALTAVGDKIISDGGSEAVKAEAIASCKIGVWGSLLHVMAVASVIRWLIYSFYPEVRPLMHQLLNPRLSVLDDGLRFSRNFAAFAPRNWMVKSSGIHQGMILVFQYVWNNQG